MAAAYRCNFAMITTEYSCINVVFTAECACNIAMNNKYPSDKITMTYKHSSDN